MTKMAGWMTMIVFPCLIIGCATDLENRFVELCKEHFGLKYNGTFENVEGFLDRSDEDILGVAGCGNYCREALSPEPPVFGTGKIWGYKYVEAEVNDSQFRLIQSREGMYHNGTSYYLIDGPGIYRFSLEKTGHKNCSIYTKWMNHFLSSIGVHQYRELYDGYCIATEKIEKLESRFEINHQILAENINTSEINTYKWTIVDRINGTLIADYRLHYTYHKNGNSGHSCDWKYRIDGDFPHDVIRPTIR